MEQVSVLGSTGSIGCSTLDVIARHPDRYQVFALSAHRQVNKLFGQCQQFKPQYAVLTREHDASELRLQLKTAGLNTEVLSGHDALCQIASASEVDSVMAAIVGAAGLLPNLAAVQAGKKLLLANKESLVMAGELFMAEVAKHQAPLLPIDSEHNAIFQCLPADYSASQRRGVRQILLTASGGPFRTLPLDQLAHVTPAQACAHPNWSMGRKISVDSATMMNKGLELIEARWLFDLPADQIEVVIHPQSTVHSMVAYCDGSVLAQLGNPDMRTPIAFGLAWPKRIDAGVAPLNLFEVARLDFSKPCTTRFPALALARQALQTGGTALATLNAANEVAVAAFLGGKIGFTQITQVIDSVLQQQAVHCAKSLDRVLAADAEARRRADQWIVKLGGYAR